MAEALKTFFSSALVRRLAADLARAWPDFPAQAFVAQASAGLDALELMDRGRHLARALAVHLPDAYPDALEILLRSLGPEDEPGDLDGPMAPFYYLPHTLFVAERGLDHFDLSMRAQRELTKRFTAEFSVRPFLAKDPERALAFLRTWARDPDPRVRRLVSEGTRLRLPWGNRVAWLDAHPDRVVALLEPSKDDPAELVRRSVANNLNDLGKVHPDLAVEVCRRWSIDAPPERARLVKHALRFLVKKTHRGALEVLGADAAPEVAIHGVRLTPRRVRVGGRLRFSFELASTAARAQELVVDYAVHFVKANGATRPKVFKLRRLVLPAGGRVALGGAVSFEPMTTRRPRPGRHRIDVLVNGAVHPLAEFDVREGDAKP